MRSEAKAATRERVLKVAGRSLRRNGIAGTGVAAVMSAAGLTHGGFYAHFASKDAMTAAAITAGFAETRLRTMDRLDALPPAEALAAWIDVYLGTRHRDDPEHGCVLPALSAEAARADAATRAAVAAGHRALVDRLGDWLAALGRPDPATLAAALLAEAVGALILARVTGSGADSDAQLAAARVSLRARAGLSS